MNKKINIEISTPNGIGMLENIYVTDLGYLMIKVLNEDDTYSNFQVGDIKDLIEGNSDLKLLSYWVKHFKID